MDGHLFPSNHSYPFVLSPTTQLAPRSPAPTPPSPFDMPSPHYLPRPRIEASGGANDQQRAGRRASRSAAAAVRALHARPRHR